MKFIKSTYSGDSTYYTYGQITEELGKICDIYKYDYVVHDKNGTNQSVGVFKSGDILIDSAKRTTGDKPKVTTCDDFNAKFLALLMYDQVNDKIHEYKIDLNINYHMNGEVKDFAKDKLDFFNAPTYKELKDLDDEKNYNENNYRIKTHKLKFLDKDPNATLENDKSNLKIEFNNIKLDIVNVNMIFAKMLEDITKHFTNDTDSTETKTGSTDKLKVKETQLKIQNNNYDIVSEIKLKKGHSNIEIFKDLINENV
jgi:hypothetical protein